VHTSSCIYRKYSSYCTVGLHGSSCRDQCGNSGCLCTHESGGAIFLDWLFNVDICVCHCRMSSVDISAKACAKLMYLDEKIDLYISSNFWKNIGIMYVFV
jgi:hypothetical protein